MLINVSASEPPVKISAQQRTFVDQLVSAVVAAEVQRIQNRTRRVDQRVRVRAPGEDQARQRVLVPLSLFRSGRPSSPRKSSVPRIEPVAAFNQRVRVRAAGEDGIAQERTFVDQLVRAVVAAEVQRTQDRTRRVDQRVRVRAAR